MLIRVIDLETTGMAPPEAAVCEIGCTDLFSTATDLTGNPTSWVLLNGGWEFVRPPHPIPAITSAIHHIIDEDVKDARNWAAVCPDFLGKRTQPADPEIFAAHNAKFERQFITDEMTGGRPWICTYKCALRIWPEAPGHANQALRYWRNPVGIERELAATSHRAMPDAYVSAFLLKDMLDLAPIDDLIKWSSEPALQVKCHIGKWRGHPWKDVDEGFLQWISDRDFDEDVLFTVRHELERRRDERRKLSATSSLVG